MAVPLSDHAKALIDAHPFATLCTIQADGSPHASILWITRDGDTPLLSTTIGRRKERNLRGDPRVSIVVAGESPYDYVEIRGTATMTETGGRELIDDLAMVYNGKPYPDEPEGTVRVVVRVEPTRVR